MPYLTVRLLKRGTFEVDVEGHSLIVEDRPAGTGRGAGPSPVDIMVAGLASSVAATVDDCLAHDSHLDAGLHVTAHYRSSTEQTHRVGSVDLTVSVPELPADRLAEIKLAIGECIAGVTMPQSPEIGVVIVGDEAVSTTPR